MELKRTSFGMQIEGCIKKEYEDAFENLKRVDSYNASLEFMVKIFGALEKSRPRFGQGVDWVRDIIDAYRTIGRLFIKVNNYYCGGSEESPQKFKNLEEKIEDFESNFS